LHPALGHATYLLYRYALCPSKHDDVRAHLETTARELVAQGLESGAFRIAFRDQDPQQLNQDRYFPTLAALGDNRVLVWQLGHGDDAHYTFVEHAPSGEFQLVDADEDLAGPAWATSARIDEVIAKVAADGPLPLRQALPLLQRKTGLTAAEATLWATAQRTADPLGLVKKGKRAALATFEADPLLPFPTHMFHDLAVGSGVWMAGDWRELWDPEVLATRLADAFLRDHPELQPLTEDDERVLAAGPAGDAPQCKGSVDAAWAARLVLGGLEHPFLDQDRDGWFDHEGYHLDGIKGYSVSSPGFHLGLKWDRHSLTLERLVVPLVAALYEADGHSALVRALPTVWKKLRERLSSEGLYVSVRLDNDRVDAVAAELPDTLPSSWRGTLSKTACGDDTRVLVRHGRPTLHVRVDALVAGEPLVADDYRVVTLLRDLALLLGPSSDAFVDAAAAIAGTDRRAGDPRVAAPEVLEALSAHLGVSADAAALYLLLAALPKPTDTTTRLLLGVDKGGLAALGAELLEAGHVLEAKRAGTGRSLFLPGRWVTDRHRSHAIAWKRELLGWGDDTSRHGPSDSAFGGQIPPVAPGPLYRRVWQRIADGDGPRFDEPGSAA
jgi:hypothetical protein